MHEKRTINPNLRYEINPFISKEGDEAEAMSVAVKQRQRIVKTEQVNADEKKDFIVMESEGEGVTQSFVHQELVDDEQFIKIYSGYLSQWLLNLSKTAQRMLVVVLKAYQQEGIGQDAIFLNLKSAEKYDPTIKRGTFHKGLADLYEASIIAPSARGYGWYWLNPHYIFNGNRINFARVVRRRGKVSQDPRQGILPGVE